MTTYDDKMAEIASLLARCRELRMEALEKNREAAVLEEQALKIKEDMTGMLYVSSRAIIDANE